MVVQLGALNVLHDEVELSWGVDHVVEAHDVLVLQSLENIDFSGNALLSLGVHEVELLVDFDCQNEACFAVESLLHRSVCTLA